MTGEDFAAAEAERLAGKRRCDRCGWFVFAAAGLHDGLCNWCINDEDDEEEL